MVYYKHILEKLGTFMEINNNKTFDINNTIDTETLAKRWGVSKKTIDNRRSRGDAPPHWKITGKIYFDINDVIAWEQARYISKDAK
jgi:predicted DNA-binding transcriptional regulator AlpA